MINAIAAPPTFSKRSSISHDLPIKYCTASIPAVNAAIIIMQVMFLFSGINFLSTMQTAS